MTVKGPDKAQHKAGNRIWALALGMALSLPAVAALNARTAHDSHHHEIKTGSDGLPSQSPNGGLACRRSAEPLAESRASPRLSSTPCTLRLVKRHQNTAMVWV